MVTCSKCESGNSVDSAFCKRCGAPLDAESLRTAAQELDALLQRGYDRLHAGDGPAALQIADKLLLSHSGMASAWSLKGLALEQQGQLGAALEAYKTALECEPTSALDRVKAEQIRTKIAALAAPKPVPNKRFAAMGAAATITLVVAVGALFGSLSASAGEPAKKKAVADWTSEPLKDEPVLARSSAVQPEPKPKEEVLGEQLRPPHWAAPGEKPFLFEGPFELDVRPEKEKPAPPQAPRKEEKRKKIDQQRPELPPGGLASEPPDKGTYEVTLSNSQPRDRPGA